jgi:regulator-associated protein of mTOR
MQFINEEDEALLLTGSGTIYIYFFFVGGLINLLPCYKIDDGVVRLYKNYDGSDQEQAILVSSWRALKDMEKSNSRQSGLVNDWHQARGLLFTGGDARVIKVWDVHQEMPVMVN